MLKLIKAHAEGSNLIAGEDIKQGEYVQVDTGKGAEKPDQGHQNLINDLSLLLKEAIYYQFHDFKNTAFATPKVALNDRLMMLSDAVAQGKYDN